MESTELRYASECSRLLGFITCFDLRSSTVCSSGSTFDSDSWHIFHLFIILFLLQTSCFFTRNDVIPTSSICGFIFSSSLLCCLLLVSQIHFHSDNWTLLSRDWLYGKFFVDLGLDLIQLLFSSWHFIFSYFFLHDFVTLRWLRLRLDTLYQLV